MTSQEVGTLEELKSATVLRLEPGDKLVLRTPEALSNGRCRSLEEKLAEASGVAKEDIIVLHGGVDLAVLRKSVASPSAPIFVQLRNARDQPIAIDRTKVLSVEGLGSIAGTGPDAAEYCNVYLAMLDQPLVVRGTEEEVVAAVEGAATYDPRWMQGGARWRLDLDCLASAREIAARQAEDQHLWFADPTDEEAYLQHALRELHQAVEGKSQKECAREALPEGSGWGRLS